jgi:exosortase A-associated hydrolase 2
LWQPVLSGKVFLTQFLRLRVANAMLSDEKEAGSGTAALRGQLAAGETLEIAGYSLAPELAAAIDALDLAQMAPALPVHWFEVVPAPDRPLPPGAARVTAAWREAAVAMHIHVLACPPFWSTQEVTECPALLQATSTLFSAAPQ